MISVNGINYLPVWCRTMGRLKVPSVLNKFLAVIALWIFLSFLLWYRQHSAKILAFLRIGEYIENSKDTPHNLLYNNESSQGLKHLKTEGNFVVEDGESELSFKIPGCHCARYASNRSLYQNKRFNFSHPVESTCSTYSTMRGSGQKVFSYSYYRPRFLAKKSIKLHLKLYLEQMEEKLNVIRTEYPGWLVRLYHNISIEDTQEREYICKMYCNFDFFDLCDVTKLPTLGNLYKKQPIGRMWRFAVMGDPTVDIFLCRDTDSSILHREFAAVQEWLKSNKTYHAMRDHPQHMAPIFAGLWGARNKAILADWRNEMLFSNPSYVKNFDQTLLKNIIWARIDRKDILQHMSYHCASYKGSVPFPTKRDENYHYVGWGHYKTRFVSAVVHSVCPMDCRPKNHKEWDRC